MGGGLMQLVAYGAQDVYLTGNPQITFFKVVYRRHTNFAVEPIQQVFNGAPDFGRTVSCNLNRNGDLITNMYAVVSLNDLSDSAGEWSYVRRLGYALVEETKVEIGGSKIDEQYGDWLNIWYELSHKVGQERGHAKLVGDSSALTKLADGHPESTLYIPLIYWFNRFNGLALPLIALQYHDVRITIQYRKGSECVNHNPIRKAPAVSMDDSYLLIDYVYLDSEERKRFAQASHEYLIEQLQFTGSETVANNNKYRLNFNHPSKYLIWAVQSERFSKGNSFLVWADNGDWEAARDKMAKMLVFEAGNVDPSSVAGVLANGGTVDPLVPPPKVVGTAGTNSWRDTVLERNDLTFEDVSLTLAELDAQYPGEAALTATSYFSGVGTVDPSLTSPVDATGDVLGVYGVVARDWFNYGMNAAGLENPVTAAKLQLNGHDRFQERDGNYFNYVQPYQHFSNTPADGINVYSFALKPEDHQPSGSCNFSRIDNATLNVSVRQLETTRGSFVASNNIASGTICNIYTVNYNVLRVMSGMAGTAYSN